METRMCHLRGAWEWTCVVFWLMTSLCDTASLNVISVPENADLTCWTCPNKTDNEACNNWAPDVKCPLNFTWCMSIHRVDVTRGKSLVVQKKCALPIACSSESIGCKDTDEPGVQECVSCCNVAYCNEAVPFNHTSAIQLSTVQSSAVAATSHNLIIFTALLVVLFQSGCVSELLFLTTKLECLLSCVLTTATFLFLTVESVSVTIFCGMDYFVTTLRPRTLWPKESQCPDNSHDTNTKYNRWRTVLTLQHRDRKLRENVS